MRRRLQKLWDDVTPYGGCCPEPDMEKIRRRVDAALDGRPRAVSRRRLKLAIMAAAAVLLLTGTALAGEELIPPEFNVLSIKLILPSQPHGGILPLPPAGYDRLLEMCAPIRFSGENFRRATAQDKLTRLKNLMK